ncbi:LPXTG cell wall anchor domain-containing protein [Mesobacillus maritimus]|uniref:LPXTG cell wall anchor domain-containing protein n=1 Tax=Mesobacillus maritimus TaxID=1643336 RepID=A0ABS7K595_9BACI|nr:LPXTG cell wall anchor domain-containing protein [Mesobacillus maritimus]MBY0097280.1 LPXTG cell wall anchor domain-containing protein [Mesobacillus maritimus]
MRKKLSFLSGMAAFTLLFAPIATNTSAAELNAQDEAAVEFVRGDVYDVREDVYDVREDVYGVTEDVYGVTEDVYGVTEDVYGVTEDVYGVTEDVYGVTEDVYGVTEDVYGVTDVVYFSETYTSEQLNDLRESGKPLVVTGNVEVTIPISLLKGAEEVTVNVNKITVDGSLATYDFSILTADGKYISKFDEPVTLKFVIDPSKVTNWNDLKVYYIVDGERTNEYYQPIKFDSTTGEVWVEVSHFSAYGVFEVAIANNNTQAPASTNNQTDKAGSGDNGASNETNSGKNGSNVEATGTTTTTTSETSEGNELPNTATNNFNLLALGLLVTVMGGALLFISRTKRA